MRETILLDGIEYPFNPEKEDFIDGHVYCKKCGEQLDVEPISLFGERHIFTKACLCERKKQEDIKRQQKLQNIQMLKQACFKSPIQWQWYYVKKSEKLNSWINKQYCDSLA